MRSIAAKVYINARLAGRRITGVERFAGEISVRLLALLAQDDRYRALAIAPGNRAAASLSELRPFSLPPALSVLWEQFLLPMRARGGFLVNLANTGPLVLRRQLVVICDASVFAVPDNYSLLFRAWYQLALNALLRRAERIVTISGFSRAELAHYCGVPASRIEVVHCGGDHLDGVIADATFPRRAGLTPGRYVLGVGTPSRVKNLAALGRAMARLRDGGLHLALVGDMDASVFRAHRSELPPATRMLGYASDAELKALYQQALCFAFPSRYEGFGLPPLEAMRCGCPVVASSAASLREVCGEAALYADADDSDGFAQHIRALAESESLREDFRARGRAHAGRYTWDAATKKMLALIAGAVLPTGGSGS